VGCGKLARQVVFMEQHPDIGLSFGYAENFGKTTFQGLLLYARKESDNIDSFEKLLLGNKIATFTVMVQKRCLDAVGGFDENPEFKAVEDYDLWLRIALKYRIACVPEIFGKYRVHPLNISGNKVKERMKLLKIAEKFKKDGLVEVCSIGRIPYLWMVRMPCLVTTITISQWLVNSFITAKI
jgi:GT2 family glycosyltransferase